MTEARRKAAQSLREQCGAASMSALIQDALALYAVAYGALEQGEHLALARFDASGKVESVTRVLIGGLEGIGGDQ